MTVYQINGIVQITQMNNGGHVMYLRNWRMNKRKLYSLMLRSRRNDCKGLSCVY